MNTKPLSDALFSLRCGNPHEAEAILTDATETFGFDTEAGFVCASALNWLQNGVPSEARIVLIKFLLSEAVTGSMMRRAA